MNERQTNLAMADLATRQSREWERPSRRAQQGIWRWLVPTLAAVWCVLLVVLVRWFA